MSASTELLIHARNVFEAVMTVKRYSREDIHKMLYEPLPDGGRTRVECVVDSFLEEPGEKDRAALDVYLMNLLW